jgi:hypothetical protein
MRVSRSSTARAGGFAVIVAVLVAILLSLALALSAQEAQAQGAKPTEASLAKRTRHSASGLVVDRYVMGMVMLSGQAYRVAKFTQMTASGGTRISGSDLKKNQTVDIEYYQGGKTDEQYPFDPTDKVLIKLQVVGTKK